ncbi:MAG: lipase family protein [Actinomycetota bacterium]|nr:lipase family protein [Actinomycetota bacterium]
MADSSPAADPPDNAPPGDAFYAPPILPAGGQHGDPVWQRPLDNPAAVLADGDCWLVLYQSQDAQGNPIATSGIVALPSAPPPAGGYPVVSWAHGTVGVASLCAPSRDQPGSSAHPMNAYPQTLLNALLQQGYAVTMTDYEGLGTTDRRHPYLLGASEAHGVLDIVRNARCLFGSRISGQFAIAGHSQGGQAALFAAHFAPDWTPELDLAGVAAIAPANHPLALVQAGAASAATNPGYAFTPLFLSGAIGGDPGIDPAQVLSPGAFATNWPQVDQRCRAGLSQTDSWGGLQGIQQFAAGYPAAPNAHQQRFNQQLAQMNPAVTLTAPARVTQAADDERVYANPAPLPGTDTLIQEINAANSATGNTVTYQRYPAGTVPPDPTLGVHFATINYDLQALISWLGPLFTPPD